MSTNITSRAATRSAATETETHRAANAKRAAMASLFGGMLEYYDFYIYATAAALVFNRVFFDSDGVAATLASLATFGVAYVARPFGAIVLGHFGDRVGRKQVLIIILLLMGVATFLIGCLPSAAQIGIWAPILLVVLRLLQGVSAGAETATASTLTIEVAPEGKRARYVVWSPNGIVAGFVLASVVFVPIAMMPEEQLFAWGWRIPFWASFLVLIVGYLVRRKLEEPEAFLEARESNELAAMPLFEVLRDNRAAVLRVALCALFALTNTIVAVWGLSFATGAVGLERSTMLWVAVASNVLAFFTQPLLAALSDKIGRKPLFLGGAVGCGVLIFPYFQVLASGNVPLIFLMAFLLTSLAYGALNATYATFFAEMFPLRTRNTGMAVGIQLGFVLVGFAPAIASLLTASNPTNWMPVAIFVAITNIIAGASALSAKETAHTPLKELGKS